MMIIVAYLFLLANLRVDFFLMLQIVFARKIATSFKTWGESEISPKLLTRYTNMWTIESDR